jgi:hypothetical protein
VRAREDGGLEESLYEAQTVHLVNVGDPCGVSRAVRGSSLTSQSQGTDRPGDHADKERDAHGDAVGREGNGRWPLTNQVPRRPA